MLMKTLHLIIPILVLSWLLTGCRHDNATMEQLQYLDSLVNHQGEGEALPLLQQIKPESLDKEARNFYMLTLTMAQYKNYLPFTSDSAISEVVQHYSHSGDKVMYQKALIAQGCVNEDLGNLEKAVEIYHRAEALEPIPDSASTAYAKMRLANLYHKQYDAAEATIASKYTEAARLFRSLGEKHYEMVCLNELGALYRSIDSKQDSVPIVINRALELAKDDKDPYFLFDGNYALSEFYTLIKNDYRRGADYGVKAINIAGKQIEHPRAHYATAQAYLNLGKRDSALYYMKHAPAMTSIKDTVTYYWTMAKIAKHDRNWEEYIRYYDLSNNISDSLLSSGLNHRLLAVEKKYDLQLAELNQVKNELKFRGVMLVVALLALLTLALVFLVWRYRNRLKMKQQEADLLRADLDGSLASLQRMQTTIDHYEQNLKAAQTELKGNETEIAALQAKHDHSNEMRAIVDGQIKIIHELLQSSYEMDGSKFAAKFAAMMSMPEEADVPTYWSHLQALVNDLYGNVLVAAQERAGGTLNDSEVNYLALYCCGFSRTVIMICMKYSSTGTVSNKKSQIARKLNVDNLDTFVNPYRVRREESEVNSEE